MRAAHQLASSQPRNTNALFRIFSTMKINPDSDGMIAAAEHLRQGGLVAFPTETVYGLGANAMNSTAIDAIFKAKQRPKSDPLIVHVYSEAAIDEFFDFGETDDVRSHLARSICLSLTSAFWPGPLTIIYKANSRIAPGVTSGTGFVGLRSPKHPIAASLLKAAGVPIAAPSANRFGHVSPTTADHVCEDLGTSREEILVLQDDVELTGGCRVGIESTVCRVSPDGDRVTILRCGAVSAVAIRTALQTQGHESCVVSVDNERGMKKGLVSGAQGMGSLHSEILAVVEEGAGAVAPGQLLKHYAPDLPTFIVTQCDFSDDTKERKIGLDDVFVVDFGGRMASLEASCAVYVDLSPAGNVEEACSQLFRVLREAEGASAKREGVCRVLLPDLRDIVSTEADDMTQALWERLHRAASGNIESLISLMNRTVQQGLN
eukprot:gene13464-28530_t